MKNKLSFFALLFISVLIIFFDFKRSPEWLLTWDQFGYYLYLPLTFIYHDLGIRDFSVVDTLMHIYQPMTDFYQGIQLQDGSYVLRYTAGLSILYSPGFCAGHLYAWLFDYPMDGFSSPYQYAILGWSILFLIIGLQHLRLILLYYFSDTLSAFLLLVVFFGTNFLVMSGHDGILLVNTYLFTLFSIMLWNTIKWHETHKLSSAIIIGTALGLSALTRPVDIIFILIPLLWGVKDIRTFREKIVSLFTVYKWHVFLLVALTIGIGALQLIYWKNRTGSFFYDSYSANAGEGFDFATPYILNFLFSFRKGWLIYTPVMIFAIAGFFVLFKKKREAFWATSSFFLVFLFLVSSWTYWWYATCYSQRTMLEIYSLLAIPLGFFVEWSGGKNKIVKSSVITIILLLAGLNLFQSWQYKSGILDGERMSKEYYWAIFLKTQTPANAEDLMLVDRSENAFLDESKHNKTEVLKKIDGIKIDSNMEFYTVHETTYNDLTDDYYCWLRVKVKMMKLSALEGMPLLIINFLHEGKAYEYKSYLLLNDSSLPDQWITTQADYLTPEVRNASDKVQVYIWNKDKIAFETDSLVVDKFEPKGN